MVWAEHVSQIGNPVGVAATLGWPLETLERIATELQSAPIVLTNNNSDDREWDPDVVHVVRMPHYALRTVVVRRKRRIIHVPQSVTNLIQKQIRELLRYPTEELLHQSCHGYRTGRSSRSNAAPHAGRTFLQKFDVMDFFPSTSNAMVNTMLSGLGFDDEASKLLADLCTLHDSLPMGSPTSPAISNLMLRSFDWDMAREAEPLGITYTRYADDLTFSADHQFDVTDRVGELLAGCGYQLAKGKTATLRRGQAATVTGLVVWDGPTPRLPKRFRNRLLTELHYIELHGIEEHSSREYSWPWIDAEESPEKHVEQTAAHIRGKILYALSVQRPWMERALSLHPRASRELMGSDESRSARRASRVGFMRKQADAIRARSESRAPRWPDA